MESAIFDEEQEIQLRRPLALFSGAAFFVIPLFTTMPLWLILLMFSMGIGMSTLISAFMKMRTRVTQTTLTFGPAIFFKTIPATDLHVVGPTKIPLMAGVGIHRYRGKIYYNMRLGKGLEVRHDKKVYVIGTAKMDEFQAALRDQARIVGK